MGIEFKIIEKHNMNISNLARILHEKNDITYDSDLYQIILKEDKISTLIGYITKYKVPANKSCYIDIFILSEYRNRGFGSMCLKLFIEKYLNMYTEIYIKSKDKYKSEFLKKNDFKFIEENLYKDLFVKTISLSM